MRNLKKGAAAVMAVCMATTILTSKGMVKAAEAEPVKITIEEAGIVSRSSATTKSTEGRFYIRVNGVHMLTVVQKATWAYGNAVGAYPTIISCDTNVMKVSTADGTYTYSLGNATYTEISRFGVNGIQYKQNMNVSVWGIQRDLSVFTKFYVDGSYEFGQNPSELSITRRL